MDDDIKVVIDKVFSSSDSKKVLELLEIVGRNLPEANRRKRISELESAILKGIE